MVFLMSICRGRTIMNLFLSSRDSSLFSLSRVLPFVFFLTLRQSEMPSIDRWFGIFKIRIIKFSDKSTITSFDRTFLISHYFHLILIVGVWRIYLVEILSTPYNKDSQSIARSCDEDIHVSKDLFRGHVATMTRRTMQISRLSNGVDE